MYFHIQKWKCCWIANKMRQYDISHPNAILIELIVIYSMFVLTCLLDLSFYKKIEEKHHFPSPVYIFLVSN